MKTVLTVKVVPNARRTECEGLMDDGVTLRVRLAAPPVDGKANEALTGWLAERLGAPRGAVRLVSGQASRVKRIAIDGVSAEEAIAALTGRSSGRR